MLALKAVREEQLDEANAKARTAKHELRALTKLKQTLAREQDDNATKKDNNMAMLKGTRASRRRPRRLCCSRSTPRCCRCRRRSATSSSRRSKRSSAQRALWACSDEWAVTWAMVCVAKRMRFEEHMRMDMGVSKPMTPRNINRIKAKRDVSVSGSVECVA